MAFIDEFADDNGFSAFKVRKGNFDRFFIDLI